MGKIVLYLDRIMVENKIPLNVLSEKIVINNVNLSKMKNNKVTAVRFSTLEALCRELQCQPGDLLKYEED